MAANRPHTREDALGGLLTLAGHQAQGKWEAYGLVLRDLERTERQVANAYLEAIRWAHATLAIL